MMIKNIFLLFALLLFPNFSAQNSYEKELEDAKFFVKEIYKNNPSEILNYVKLSDSKLKLCTTDDQLKNYIVDGEWNMFYRIIRKGNKIVYISKSNNMWGGIGDWLSSQDFYFNKDGILIGAIKKENFFLEEPKCARQIQYRAYYKNVNAPKLDRVQKILNEDEKEIDLSSPACKGSKKMILESIDRIDKITFRTVEGFMKSEKIKYYK